MTRKPKLIGILGGGQLGQMLALAGIPLGLKFRVWDPAKDCCARLCAEHICAPYDDPTAIEQFAEGLDLITYEFENVPTQTLAALEKRLPIHPSRKALAVSQDRLAEKDFFYNANIPVTEYYEVNSAEDLALAMGAMKGPSILKSRRFGYDGKGQLRISGDENPADAWAAFGNQAAVLERMLTFEREVSCLGAGNTLHEFACYPLFENVHQHGILKRTTTPAAVSPKLEKQAQEILAYTLKELDYFGLLTIEFFVVEGKLVVNEMAPRVHNSGHLTLEAFPTSQFEQHLRAICGLPLGNVELRSPAVMINCIGKLPPLNAVLKIPRAAYHDYGKLPRDGRKVGHITLTADTLEDAVKTAEFVEKLSTLEG
ncbi:MAG: 5-(carboxyamino)imidazole ribonucleotide synthase [Sumerlaeia bacterium]